MALSDDLIAYWPMDTPGAFSPDVVTGRHFGKGIGDALTTAAGKVGSATVFTAAGQDIFVVKHHADLPGNFDFTFSCWVYLTNKSATKDFISRWSPMQIIIGYVTGTDRFRFLVRNATNTANPIVYANNLGSPSLNTWYHIVCWHDATADTINIQVNDGAVDSLPHADGVNTVSSGLYIGGRNEIDTANAYLDEIGYWKRVLTAGERTDLYNSGNGITYPFAGETPAELHSPGIWSWYTNPRAVRFNGKTYWGTIESNGDIFVFERDDTTGAANSFILAPAFDIDDHAHASILVRDSDSKLLVFYSTHVGTNALWLRIGTNAENAGAFGAATNLDGSLGGGVYSYPCAIQLTGETNDPIYLFYREGSGGYNHYFSTSTDGGASWAAGTHFFDNGDERPYFVYAQNGTARIDFACTDGHPAAIATNSIYHFYYEGGNWYKTDGTLIGDGTALPLEPADVTKVYDGTTIRSWTWDIAIDGSGHPVIVYATFPTAASDHRYRYARWNGSSWTDAQVCTAGGPLYAAETYYSGGITIDKADPNIVYVSRYVSSQWEIYKYVTADGGATWDAGTAITSSSSEINARPYSPVGADTAQLPLWWKGTYTSYTSFDGRTIIPALVEAAGGIVGRIFDSPILGWIVR